MSRCFLRAVVFLPAFLIPTLIGFAQRQEPDERLTPTRPGQPRSSRVASPGLRFDPRQAVGSASSIQQANTFAGSLALGSSAGTSLGASGIFLEAPLFSSGGNWANAVAVADVNGDGKRDFVAVNWGDGTLGVLLGNGDGTFQPVATYESGGLSSEAVAVADLNGDGRPDVVVANTCVTPSCDTSAISVSLGNGDGTFQPPVNYAPGGWSTSSLAIGDVNGDGKLDVIAGNI